MPQAIGFKTIPQNVKVPFAYFEVGSGVAGGNEQQNSLIVANTITVQPAVPVWCPSVAQAVALFGAGSLCTQMVEEYFAADPNGALYVMPLADAGGAVAATGNISFTGPATAAGTLSLYIAGKLVQVAVAAGMTAQQLATAVIAAINAWISPNGVALPVSALVNGVNNFQVDLTARNKGTQGNSIDVRLNYYGVLGGEATPAGIVMAVTAMAAGAGDPDITGLDPILGDFNYDFIAIPWSTAGQLNATQTLMANATGRWAFNRQVYGHIWAAKMDVDATGATNIAFGITRNDPHATVVSYEPAPSPPWAVSAGFMGTAAQSLRADPARPLQTLTIPGLLAPVKDKRYSWATKNTLLSSGLALMNYNADGTCTILRATTTYQKNPAGVPDASYLDAETLYSIMSFIRGQKQALAIAFPRAKLADDGTSFGAGTTFSGGQADQSITTPNGIKAVSIATYSRQVADGLVEDTKTYSKGLIVQRNANDVSRVDMLLDPIFVSGLRVLAVLVNFFLSDASAQAAQQ
jgi:phage tail sheath gpL-like